MARRYLSWLHVINDVLSSLTPSPSKDKSFYRSIFNALKFSFEVGVFFWVLFNIEQFKTVCSTLEKCFNFLWLYNVHKCLLLLLVLYSILATASNLPNYDYYVCVTQSYALLLLNADILRQKLVVQLGTCFLPCFGLS